MKNNKKLLSKFLTIILSTMMIFSSVLVVNTNVVLAEVGDEETKEIIEAPETEDKKDDEDFVDGETKKEEPADGEETANVNPEQLEEQSGDENKTSGDEVTNKEESSPEIITESAKETEQEETVSKAPKKMMSSPKKLGSSFLKSLSELLFPSKTHKVTFKVDRKTVKPTNDLYSYYSKVPNNTKLNNEPIFGDDVTKPIYGWYQREYNILGFVKSEKKWNFSTDAVTENITLYAKYLGDDFSNRTFDIRVKHVDSIGVSDEEYLSSHTAGDYLKRDSDGYLYSYYSYYNKDSHNTLLQKLIKYCETSRDFTGVQVEKYDYVMQDDQVTFKVVSKYSDIDNNNDNKVDDGFKEAGTYCALIDSNFEYQDDNRETKTGVLVQIGNYYQGTAFDLAIQEANSGDTIELLNSLYITTPIEIWGDVNLDLKGHTVIFNENSKSLNILHYINSRINKSDVVIPKEICANIIVTNAKTKISNGTLDNYHSMGRGIVDISFDKYYEATLEDININVDNSSNLNKNAVEAGYNLIDDHGNLYEASSGYINYISGNVKGYLLNNNGGKLLINEGVNFKYNPLTLSSGKENGVSVPENYQVWGDGSGEFEYVVGQEAEAKIGEKQYRTLKDAVDNVEDNETITLLKDIDLINSNGVINLDNDITYTIDNNSYTIIGNDINIIKGNVTLTGSGYVKAKTHVKAGDNETSLTIKKGNYYSIYNEKDNSALRVEGGNFIDYISSDFYDSGYTCYNNESPLYKYTVVSTNSESAPITIIKNDEGSSSNTLVDAIKTINNDKNGSNIYKIVINQDLEINNTITINRPLTLDFNNHKLTSTVDYNPSETIGYASIYINVTGFENNDVELLSGTFFNKSIAGDSDTVYGIYIEKGNLKLGSLTLNMQSTRCRDSYAIYSKSANSKVELNKSNLMLQNFVTYGQETAVYNAGFMKLIQSTIFATSKDNCRKLVGIYNSRGKLELTNGSVINCNTKQSTGSEATAIRSTGDVYIAGTGTKLVVSTNGGEAYGIHQENVNSKKTITIENGGSISVTNENTSSGTTYGIYTDEEFDEDINSNILLGKSYIYSSSTKQAFGVYTAGGYIYAGTVNGQVHDGMFDKTLETTHDDVFDANYDKFAYIIVNGGNGSIGIDCEYGTKPKVANQLVNTVINMQNATGNNSYCVTANTAIVGTDIIGGYYYTSVNNRMMNGDVFCKDGYYNRDVSLNTSKGNKCYRLNNPVHFMAMKDISNSEEKQYEYAINFSNCSLDVSCITEDDLALKLLITYDPLMMKEPTKYGIKVTIESLNVVDYKTIANSSRENSTSNRFVYIERLPIKAMSEPIKIEIVGFDETGKPVHTYHSKTGYSVESYFYSMLDVDEITGKTRDPEVRDLAAASLNLGTAAQNYFGSNSSPANANLNNYYDAEGHLYSKDLPANITITEQSYQAKSSNFDTKFEYLGHSLLLESKTTLRFEFSLKGNESISDYKFESIEIKYDNDGSAIDTKTNIITPVKIKDATSTEKAVYILDIKGISMSNIINDFQIKATNDNKNSQEYNTVYTENYSPLDYVIYTTLVENYPTLVNLLGSTEEATKLVQLMKTYYICYLKSSKIDFGE